VTVSGLNVTCLQSAEYCQPLGVAAIVDRMRALDLFKGWHFDQEIIFRFILNRFCFALLGGVLVQEDRAETRKPNILVTDVMIRGLGHIKAGAREKICGFTHEAEVCISCFRWLT
jgi:hypothetical protein